MSGSGNKLSAECCAKTNLYLRVAGKRPDSFHDIETVFWPVRKVTDLLQMDFSPGRSSAPIVITSNSSLMPKDSSNLCWKAVESYFAAAGLPPRPIAMHLEKRIPISAGMGGGSSNCAATLLLMEEYFGALGKEKLALLAASLGSDVPFFLDPAPSIGRGRGEKLEKIPCSLTLPLLFAAPLFPVSAAWAYTHLDYELCAQTSPSLAQCAEALLKGSPELLGETLRNDLAPALYRKFPLLEILHRELESSGAKALLSGSGPTLFALCRDEDALARTERELGEKFRGMGISLF